MAYQKRGKEENKNNPIEFDIGLLVNDEDYQKDMKWKTFFALKNDPDFYNVKVNFNTILFGYNDRNFQINATDSQKYGGKTFDLWERDYSAGGEGKYKKTMISDVVFSFQDGVMVSNEDIVNEVKQKADIVG